MGGIIDSNDVGGESKNKREGRLRITMEGKLQIPTSNRKQCLLSFLLYCSIAVNVFLSGLLLDNKGGKKWEMNGGWTREAAEEAEAVASISCSGHGTAFLDSSPVDGKPASCECFACFTGPDCSQLSDTGCIADADSGNPLFLEPFWRKHASSSSLMVTGWHRMSYVFGDGSVISKELEKHVRELHAFTGNAITHGKYIVFGVGTTQLLNCAVHALSSLMSSSNNNASSSYSPIRVVASAPFYTAYQMQTDLFQTELYKFQGDAALWKNHSEKTDRFVEFVTSPNNPDGQLNKAVLQGPYVKTIHDHAYYWPHFTAISAPADEDLMLFTLSKLTGHAGSRFGWALIRNEAVYKKMLSYGKLNTIGVSHDTQLRALKLLKVVLRKGGGREIFEFAHNTMKERWQRLSNALSSSLRFSLQEIPPQFCTFFQQVREPSPAYAWLRCNRWEDEDCYDVLQSAGIKGRDGRIFGGGEGHRYVRLSLLKSQDDFDLLINKIQKLVSSEDYGPKTT